MVLLAVRAGAGTAVTRCVLPLPAAQERRLTLRFAPRVTGYAFTFG